MAGTDPDGLRPYLDAGGWQLIPLHRHDYFDEHRGRKRERGKSPLHAAWTTRFYASAAQVAHLADGGNVGVRLTSEQLVVDVDPRNFPGGDDPFRRLCADAGLGPGGHPTVCTGSGGLHLYMTKPADQPVVDSLEGYPGVEFKTRGRQVVAAGSLHPNGRTYAWEFPTPDLADAAPAPDGLMRLIRRPDRAAAATGGGEHTQEEVASMLDALDPEDFRDHGRWLELMQACHHASGGDARAEFAEWSTRDPEYADQTGEVGRRWDSLHADAGGPRVTYRTLHKLLRDAGRGDAVARAPAAEDFEDDLPPEAGVPEHERKGPMERMNERFTAVMEVNRFRVYERDDAGGWRSYAKRDFEDMLSNRTVQRGDRVVPLATAWLESRGRSEASGVEFDPSAPPGIGPGGRLNLWTGWAVRPAPGDWGLLDDLLLNVLCDGDEALHRYVLNWAAHMVQRPGEPAETAICFQGDEGVGKGTFFRALAALAGRHGLQVTSSEHLTGRFNSHLRDCILLFADEAIKPHDREAESRLKALITEPRLSFEAKGRDLQTDRNRIHIVMASNHEWFVPMGLQGARRFVLQAANNRRRGDFPFFAALDRQLHQGGGLGALLHDLLARDIRGWHPRADLPGTQMSLEQKIRGAGPLPSWWMAVLEEGAPPAEALCGGDWTTGPIRVLRQDLRDSFAAHCEGTGARPWSNGRQQQMLFAKELARLCGPGVLRKTKVQVPADRHDVRAHADGRAHAMELPPLPDCRAMMEKVLGGALDWSPTEDDPLEF